MNRAVVSDLGSMLTRAAGQRASSSWRGSDVEFTPIIMGVEGGAPYRGQDDVRSLWKKVHDIFPDFNVALDEVRDLGDIDAGVVPPGARRVRVRAFCIVLS